MNTVIQQRAKIRNMKVLLIGNNPIDLSAIYEILNSIKKIRFIPEIAFDKKDLFSKARNIKPECILIDDNMDQDELRMMLKKFRNDNKTKNIPIAIIKNNNSGHSLLEGVEEFILKQNINSENISRCIANSLRFHKTQEYLRNTYRKRKVQLLKMKKKAGL